MTGSTMARSAKGMAQRLLRSAGRTPGGQRVLGFYDRSGLVPRAAVEAGPPATGETGDQPGTDLAQAKLAMLEDLWDRNLPSLPPPCFADLSEDLHDGTVPPLDRQGVDRSALTGDQRDWYGQGFLIKRRFVPGDLLDAYWERRLAAGRPDGWGWPTTAAFLHIPEAMALCTYKPLNDLLDELIGEPMGASLNLTHIRSTERNWHQDDYLNPPQVRGWYTAVWFAVGDVDPDSGPFQYVPGSHRWPVLRRERVMQYLTPEERASVHWPRASERFLDRVVGDEIERRSAKVETFLGEKGDILIWHARLVHRGSPPRVPGTIRHSFISHYTGEAHWAIPDTLKVAPGGGRYFDVDAPFEE